jgi:hypothetical protein
MMTFIVGISYSFWYYKVEGKHYLSTAYKWVFTSAFGSIVFAAGLVAALSFTCIDAKRRNTKNVAAAMCLCIFSMFFKTI